MSLNPTATVGETASTAMAMDTTTGLGSHHNKDSMEAHTGGHIGDTDPSTVIGSSTQESVTNATSLRQQQIEQSTTISGIVSTTRIRTTRTAAIRRRQKVKEFNDVILCYLCRGYLINATTIDYCVHSFCRSCIVRHLQGDKHCPQCRPGGKQIALSNLRPDERLKSLVYKLVPGLYQSEHQRQIQFYNENTTSRVEDQDDGGFCDSEEDYFSPVEPISLSLEYHPESLQGCSRQQIPPIRYLQCPAAVTIHHLKRFISSKFDIDPDNERVDIEIIYEDEVLPEDFSLMDVGYCYSWKRVAPMRFFYRILVHNLCNKTNQVVPSDSVLSGNDEVIDAKRAKKSNEATTQKTVRFKEINERQTKEKTVSAVESENTIEIVDEDELKHPLTKAKISKTEANKDVKECNNGTNIEVSKTNVTAFVDESQLNGGKGPVKMTIIARKPNEIKIKHECIKSKSKTKTLATSVTPSSSSSASVISDFKSLRSNDIRYSDYSVNSTFSSSATGTGKSRSSSSKSKTNPGTKEVNQKQIPKCDIVVSIPQAHVHRSSNSSDDSFENLSLAQLKTANKKSNNSNNNVSNFKDNSKSNELPSKGTKNEEKSKPDVPKLKIELPSLKTKITVPKKSPEVVEIKKNPKSRKHSIEEQNSPPTNQVDLTTYAKNIGLKPINPVQNLKKEEKVKNSPDNSPLSTSSSASSPPASSGSAFIFSTEGSSSTSHKKRKKGKHSKEPKEPGSKRRKLHAEISSQPAEESLKLKVKITANHKSHKADKKSSSILSVEEVTTPPIVVTATVLPTNDSIKTTTPIKTSLHKPVVENAHTSPNVTNTKPVKENKSGQELPKPTNRNKQGVNIPNLNKTLSEESSNINNLIKENSSTKSTEQFVPTTSKPPTSVSKSKPFPAATTKTVNSTALTIVTSSHPSSLPTVNQIPAKPFPTKILSIQETKLPISPPLPPSLFKTAPMTLQTITPATAKQSTPQIQPRYTTPGDVRHMAMSQLKRLTNISNQNNQGNFVVPNPPKSLPNSPKLCPITSIASAANRQAAQLKRSASLDSNPPMIPKQQKLDQDRMIRKASYAPFLTQVTSSLNTIQTSTGIKPHVNTSSPIVTSTTNSKITEQQTFYTSTMGPSYTREILSRKPMPILLPPSSISVTKMSDVIPAKLTHPTSAVTITPQQQQQPQLSSYQQPQKPALEIVRISSNIPPIDQQPIAITNNNTVKPNQPKTTRPPPPPIPLVKIKRSVNAPSPLKPTITTVSAPIQQSQILNSVKSAATITTPPTSPSTNSVPTVNNLDTAKPNGQPPICDNIGALDLSGKSSRSPSQEKNTPTNTPPDTPTQTPSKDPLTVNKQMANNLEAALNKLKQQCSTTTTSLSQSNLAQISTTQNSTSSSSDDPKAAVTSPITTVAQSSFKTPTSPNQSVPKLSDPSNGLQNLKLLSESATNREKITIKNQRTLPMMPKLNEITKMRANPTVRQQNASVRNIPNPSALAFRSHQPIPMLASITKTTSPQKSTISITSSTTTVTSTNSSVAVAVNQKPQDVSVPKLQTEISTLPQTSEQQPSTSTSSTSSTITTIATTDSSKLIGSKKNLHLEQLAATLNMRALSAAASATSSNSSPSTNCSSAADSSTSKTVSITTVSSSSPSSLSSSTTTVTSSSEKSTGSTTLPSDTSYSAVTLPATSTPTATTA